MDSRDHRLAAASTSPSRPVEATLLPLSAREGVVFVSGQVAMRDGTLLAKGVVGRDVDLELAQECARQCVRNLLGVLQCEIGSLDGVQSVLRLGVYVASADDFSDQHLVAHGASQLVLEVLGEEGRHTRTAIGVKKLPLDSPVEVDAVVHLRLSDSGAHQSYGSSATGTSD